MKMKITALTLALGMMCTFSAFAAGELRYGVEAEYPPFESRNTAGELEGFRPRKRHLQGGSAEMQLGGDLV